MAERYHDETKAHTETTIPEEYQQHAKVFSEQEATRFPPSQEWDHKIPLKPNAPETINAKMYTLPKPGRDAIEDWVNKMLKKGVHPDLRLAIRTCNFHSPKERWYFSNCTRLPASE
jgi:hypothetical protein